MNIVYTWKDIPHRWEMIRWRGISFIRAINKTGRHKAYFIDDLDFIEQTPHAKRMCELSDIIIIHQDLWGKRLGLIQHWKARGKVVISDVQFDVKSIAASHPEYNFWMGCAAENDVNGRAEIPPLTQYKWGLQLIDGATTQKIKVVNEYRSFTSVFHIPHLIDIEKYLHLELTPHEGFTLGWKGNNIQELHETGLYSALAELLHERNEIRLFVFSDEVKESDFESLPPGSLEVIPLTCGRDRWPEPMGMVDIGLVPQGRTDYVHDCEIDILEWMAMKIPWIGTEQQRGHIYRYGNIVQNEKELWKKKIFELVGNLIAFQDFAKREPYLEVIGQSLDENIQHLINTYAKIINQSKSVNYVTERIEHHIAKSF